MTKLPIVTGAAWLLMLLSPLGAQARDLGSSQHLPLPVMDLERYAGTWHHLAWLPEDFQKKCVRDSQVDYRPRRDGGFDVHRSCVDADGRRREEAAEAVPVPGAPGSLQMRSAPRWRAGMPVGWKRRWVVAVDPGYQWALVGAPDRDRLWVIAREPRMEPSLLGALVAQARDMGYPVDELVFAPDARATAAAWPAAFVASTNEPFWQATVDGHTLRLAGPELEQPRVLQRVEGAGDHTGGSARTVLARDAQGQVQMEIEVAPCQDSMSGAWFPLRARIAIDGDAAVAGCARPASMPAPGEMH